VLTTHVRVLLAATAARVLPEGAALAFVLWAALDDRPGRAGLLVAAMTLPQLVTGPLMGRVLDRSSRREPVVVGAAVLGAASALAIAFADQRLVPTLVAAGSLAVAVPVLTGGLSSVLLGWGDDTDDEADDDADVAAWDGTGYNVAGLAAPVIVTALAAVDPRWSFVALAGTALLAVPAVLAVRASKRPASPSTPRIRDALGAMWRTRPLAAVTVSTTLLSAAIGGLEIAVAGALLASDLAAERLGVLATALAIGALCGSFALTRRPATGDPVRLTLASVAAAGALTVLLAPAISTSFAAAVPVAFAIGVADGPLLVGTYRARHRFAPEHLRSSVFTLGASMKLGASALGALGAAALVAAGAGSSAVAVIGLACLLAAAVGAATAASGRGGISGPRRSAG
jgi:MFS family permease